MGIPEASYQGFWVLSSWSLSATLPGLSSPLLYAEDSQSRDCLVPEACRHYPGSQRTSASGLGKTSQSSTGVRGRPPNFTLPGFSNFSPVRPVVRDPGFT